ncbi:hypothetical protein G6F57_022477 [Rhizopus arrhizus]|nr:hypothetical protein G6F57_022477 [Rhizopus arrhizus]
MAFLCQLCHRPIASWLPMQRQDGPGQPGVAQGGHQTRSIVTATLDPTAHDHGGHHFGQAGQNAREPHPPGADFPFHGSQDGHQAGIALAGRIHLHDTGHQLAKTLHDAQV